MKIFIVGIASLLIIALLALTYISMSSSKIEKYPYQLLKKMDGFEIRKYEASNFSVVELPGKGYSETSGAGFRQLAGYIFGGNDKEQSIAMTSPVIMNFGDTNEMMFMIPADEKIGDLPRPNNPNIQFKQESEKIVAAIAFGGWANDARIKKYEAELVELLQANGINFNASTFSYLGYNPPYELINRKNEIIVELISYNQS